MPKFKIGTVEFPVIPQDFKLSEKGTEMFTSRLNRNLANVFLPLYKKMGFATPSEFSNTLILELCKGNISFDGEAMENQEIIQQLKQRIEVISAEKNALNVKIYELQKKLEDIPSQKSVTDSINFPEIARNSSVTAVTDAVTENPLPIPVTGYSSAVTDISAKSVTDSEKLEYDTEFEQLPDLEKIQYLQDVNNALNEENEELETALNELRQAPQNGSDEVARYQAAIANTFDVIRAKLIEFNPNGIDVFERSYWDTVLDFYLNQNHTPAS